MKEINSSKIKKKIKVHFRKNRQIINRQINDFFDWVKGAELVSLKECNTIEDPVRPELDNEFRTSYGRKIYGVKYKNEIHAIMCFAFTNKIPKTVKELDNLSRDAFLQSALRDQKVGQIAIAYTVWSKKKGGGKLIVKEVFKKIIIFFFNTLWKTNIGNFFFLTKLNYFGIRYKTIILNIIIRN